MAPVRWGLGFPKHTTTTTTPPRPLSCFCGPSSLQLGTSVLQICCRCPPSLLLVLCPAKIWVNLPDPGTGCKADLGSNRGVSVCPPGGGSPFTSTRFVAHAHAGLHRHSCGFTLPCKAASQVPPACEFVWGWSEPLASTWVAAPNALAPLDWQARRNCFGSLTNQSLLEGYRAFTEANDGSMCLAMEYGGEKSLNDLIEERSAERLGPFPAATIFKVALSMARGLKVCLILTIAVLCGIIYTGDTGKIN